LKTRFLTIVLAILFANVVCGQQIIYSVERNSLNGNPTQIIILDQAMQTKIANTIERSRSINELNGIMNPDSIYPGQNVRFILENGEIYDHQVLPLETETGILLEFYEWQEKPFRNVVTFTHVPDSGSNSPDYFLEGKEKSFLGKHPYLLVLFALVALMLLYVWTRKDKKAVDPTTAGSPFVEGGVHSQKEAEEHFFQLLAQKYPNSRIKLIDVQPKFLHTTGEGAQRIEYADGTHQRHEFRNMPGFQGQVSIDDGEFETEYFLEKCGNPVSWRRSFRKSKRIFATDEPLDYIDESIFDASFMETNPAEETQKTEEEENSQNSELSIIVAQHLSMTKEFMSKRNAYSAETVIVRDSEGWELKTTVTRMRPNTKKVRE
jgi:hypothetical protein